MEEVIINIDENGKFASLEADTEVDYPFILTAIKAEGNEIAQVWVEVANQLGKVYRIKVIALANSGLDWEEKIPVIK